MAACLEMAVDMAFAGESKQHTNSRNQKEPTRKRGRGEGRGREQHPILHDGWETAGTEHRVGMTKVKRARCPESDGCLTIRVKSDWYEQKRKELCIDSKWGMSPEGTGKD